MTKDQLINKVKYIYNQCSNLINESIGFIPEAASNVAIFCQSEDEYRELQQLADTLVIPSNNPRQKYFQLRDSIAIQDEGVAPSAVFSWLYIRKPAQDTPESGDIDYVLNQSDYDTLKREVLNHTIRNGSVYDRIGWDMIEFRNEQYDGIPYICTLAMAEKVRLKF